MTRSYLDLLEVALQESGLLEATARRGHLRIVFTGSRDLPPDMLPVIPIMFETVHLHFGRNVRLAHGRARGADHFADVHARRFRWKVQPYPVARGDWDRYGGYAGQKRNGEMLTQEAPDLVLATQYRRSSGTGGCVMDALTRGISVVLVDEELARLPRSRGSL